MSKSRRQFLTHAPLALLGAAVASYGQDQKPAELPPGAPPAFGTAPAVGPQVSPATFAEAEKLVEVEFSSEDLAEAAGNWRSAMAPLYERRVGPRKVAMPTTLAPWSRWDPVLPGQQELPQHNQFVRSKTDPGPLPASDEDIAWLYDGAPLPDILRLWGLLGPSLVVVTRGDQGAVMGLTVTGEFTSVDAPTVEVVDTVGAGDSFMAGLLSGLLDAGLLGGVQARERLRSASLADVRPAVNRALACAAVTVSRAGANPPRRAELAMPQEQQPKPADSP